MAKNLLAKSPGADELIVCDTNETATDSFFRELEGRRVQVARSPREVAEKSVGLPVFILLLCDEHCSIDDLSWGAPSWSALV